MSDDFTLTPAEPSPRQLPLAPTAAVPSRGKTQDFPPCYAPCAACGRPVLHGETTAGQHLVLDTAVRTYSVVWPNGAVQPILLPSPAYPTHHCVQKEP
jgi:hypothetical protein